MQRQQRQTTELGTARDTPVPSSIQVTFNRPLIMSSLARDVRCAHVQTRRRTVLVIKQLTYSSAKKGSETT